MGTLSDRDLIYALRQRTLVIQQADGTDWFAGPCQPAGIDLHLGNEIRTLPNRYDEQEFDPEKDREVPTALRTFEEFRLWPDQFILVATQEHIGIDPRYEGIITGKSSWARVGIQVEAAGYVDPGWGRPIPRPLTMEIKNQGSLIIVLRPGMKICQLRIATMNSTPARPYGHPDLGSHYADSVGPVAGRFGLGGTVESNSGSDSSS